MIDTTAQHKHWQHSQRLESNKLKDPVIARDAWISSKVSVIRTDSGIFYYLYLYLYQASKMLTDTDTKKLKTFDEKFSSVNPMHHLNAPKCQCL